MIRLSSHTSPGGEEMAEGSPGSQEIFEPDLKLKTTTMPAIVLDKQDAMEAEEPLVSRTLNHPAEGSDNDDLQDAALESGEPKASSLKHRFARE